MFAFSNTKTTCTDTADHGDRIPMTSTASPAELAQTCVAAGAIIFNVWGLVRALHDAQWLDAAGFNGARRFWARSRVRQEVTLLACQVTVFVMGVFSLLLPPPSGGTSITTQGRVRVIGLIVLSVLLLVKTYISWRDRGILQTRNWGREPWDGRERRDGQAHY